MILEAEERGVGRLKETKYAGHIGRISKHTAGSVDDGQIDL